jgi:anaerobic selenocysteine-containing dehydrogenase
MPKHVSSGLLYGAGLAVPVPDVDRTMLWLVIGANPLISNGSLMTVPDLPERLRELRRRGGRLVVVDPLRTRTAEAADEHIRIRPGTDVVLLAGLARLLADDPDLGAAAPHVAPADLDAVRAAVAAFTPERVEQVTGVPAGTLRRLADDLRTVSPPWSTDGWARRRPACATAGRHGVVRERGLVARRRGHDPPGNLDGPAAHVAPGPRRCHHLRPARPGQGVRLGEDGAPARGCRALRRVPAAAPRRRSTPRRRRHAPAGLVVVAGNPVVSLPEGARLAWPWLRSTCSSAWTPTSRRPAGWPTWCCRLLPFARDHIDAVRLLAVRRHVRWSPPVLPLDRQDGVEERDEADVLLQLAAIALGDAVDVDGLDDLVLAEVVRRAVTNPQSPAFGADHDEVVAAVSDRRRVARVVDVLLRSGPFGDGFGRREGGLTLATLEAAPHGIDLGPLEPRLPEVLRTPSGRIELAPEPLLAQLSRLESLLDAPAPDGLVLVGRRQQRSNNSWLHNLPTLARGAHRCTLQVHPDDATALGLHPGGHAVIATDAGEVVAEVEVTDVVMPGVVCLPHGWGHRDDDAWGPVARARPGASSNDLTPADALDGLSGNAVLNGVLVTVRALGSAG